MNRYEFEDEDAVTYEMYDVEVIGLDGECVVLTDAKEDYDEVEALYNLLYPSAGATCYLRCLKYSKPNYTGYLRTEVVKQK